MIGETVAGIENAVELSFELGHDDMAVTVRWTKEALIFAAKLMSASAADGTKETWQLRMTNPTKKYQLSKWTMLLPILPTLAIIFFQKPKEAAQQKRK
jgi:hypothetical protein